MATARWLRAESLDGCSVYIVGAADLAKEVLGQPGGFDVDAELPDYVVVGLDTEVTYAKPARRAWRYLGGTAFVATNVDASLPVERRRSAWRWSNQSPRSRRRWAGGRTWCSAKP